MVSLELFLQGTTENNQEGTVIPEQNSVERVAAILGISKASLVGALTSRTITVQGETVTTAISTDQSR